MMQSFDDFIMQTQVYDGRIDHHLANAERLRSLCDRVTTIWGEESIQTSKENIREQRLADLIDSKRDLEVLISQRKRAYKELRSWLYDNLSLEYASILEYRFIDRLSLSEIADRLGYSYQTVKNKSSVAMQNARETYERNNSDGNRNRKT